MSNLKEIAKASGVSLETASRVLNGKYKGRTERSKEVMRLVEEAAKRLDYRPHNAARSMRTSCSGLIGLIVEETVLMTHPVISETMKGINQSLTEGGYVLTITSLDGVSERTFDLRVFHERLLDGIIVVDNISSEYTRLMRARLPACVAVNNNEWLSHNCVRRDEYAAGFLAGSEMAKLGYEEALYFELPVHQAPDFPHYSERDRLDGFRDGFKKAGKVVYRHLTQKEMAPRLTRHLIESKARIGRKTVIVAATCLVLYCLKSAFPELGLRSGVDFGLICLDDETGLLKSSPDVSRVSFPRVEIGRIAGRMVQAALQGDEDACRSVAVQGAWLPGSSAPRV